ncbi:MAG: hypothetical protein J3K34DRAFT_497518, partial [Monoraphidium minutum]
RSYIACHAPRSAEFGSCEITDRLPCLQQRAGMRSGALRLLSSGLSSRAFLAAPELQAAAMAVCACSSSARAPLLHASAAAAAACSASASSSSFTISSSRGMASAAAAAAAAPSQQAAGGGGAAGGPGPKRPRRAVPPELEAMSFAELAAHVRAMTVTNPLSEAKVLLLAQKAASAADLSHTLKLAAANRARASRLRQYHPYTSAMPSALVQAAKRVQAPGSFYVELLERAAALGLPMSANLAEAALAACSAPEEGPAFDAAWVLARAQLPRPSRHMVYQAMRSLAARGRPADAAAAARGAGAELAPAAARLLPELERAAAEAAAAAVAEGGSEAGGGGAGGEGEGAAAVAAAAAPAS